MNFIRFGENALSLKLQLSVFLISFLSVYEDFCFSPDGASAIRISIGKTTRPVERGLGGSSNVLMITFWSGCWTDRPEVKDC